jgi:hypothetical protein
MNEAELKMLETLIGENSADYDIVAVQLRRTADGLTVIHGIADFACGCTKSFTVEGTDLNDLAKQIHDGCKEYVAWHGSDPAAVPTEKRVLH